MKAAGIYKMVTGIILLVCFLAQNFSSYFIMADYYANRTTYAANCINKARPMMHCNGKCQLMKKIREQEKKDQENQDRKMASKSGTTLSSKSFFPSIDCVPETLAITTTPAYYHNNYTYHTGTDIFHPPQA